MEDIPPSYYQSINPSVLDLIAPHLDTASLHSLALVSRAYNETFMPHLWGSPASHFVPIHKPNTPGINHMTKAESTYDDMVYVALTRFKRILKIARESTRRLTHTLFLPAAASEIYSGPNASWLREILDGLPSLQSLCLSGLPFFDHHSLVAVERHRQSVSNQHYQTYNVKLLLASKEPNTTSIGLSLFLPHLPHLVYLDLSYTSSARDMNVLSSLSALSDLQVLKLRGIGLRDPEAEVLANAIGLRVRLLDVAENFLGDMSIRSLLQACFVHPIGHLKNGNLSNGQNSLYQTQSDYHSRRYLESWPVGLPPAPDFLSLDTLRSADFDKNLLVQLTNPLTGRLAFEDIPHGGITHLYITGNPAVTIEGVKSLLEVGRLHVLDAGDVAGETAVDKYVRSVRDSGKWHSRTKSIGSAGVSTSGSRLSGGHHDNENDERIHFDDDILLPGAEKLIPVLREKASKNLTHLRIEHSVVTKKFETPREQENSKTNGGIELSASTTRAVELKGSAADHMLAEAPGSNHLAVEAPGSNYQPVELPDNPHIFELDATPVVRAELPGDIIHFAISPPIGDKPEPETTEPILTPIRGVGPYAPEVVPNVHEGEDNDYKTTMTESDSSVVERPISPMAIPPPVAESSLTIDSVISPYQSIIPKHTTASPSLDRQAQIEKLMKRRPTSPSSTLHPSCLSNLRTLILTSVPSQVADQSPILRSIQVFITACAAEAFIAVLKARTNYSLPPGRARAAAERKHAQSLFALKKIVLEVSPVQDTRQRDWKHTRQRLNISKSSTGDRDSEALWSAAENDFSFFGEEGEEVDECGIYDHEPGKYFPSVHVDDKFSITPDDASTPTSWSTSSNTFNNTLGMGSPTSTVFRSPRELPLGRNRRSSNEYRHNDFSSSPGRTSTTELMGTTPTPQARPAPPTSAPKKTEPPQMVDLVQELSKWRKARKVAYEEEVRRRSRVNGVTVTSRLVDNEVYVEGHWKGEISVIRNSKPIGSGANRGQGRLEKTGMVDIFGNYFEKGYLYS